MSEALERVIAEQQKEIDRLRTLDKNSGEHFRKEYEEKMDFYAEVWRVVTFLIPDKIRETFPEETKRINAMLWRLKEKMEGNGFCTRCASFYCECHEDY